MSKIVKPLIVDKRDKVNGLYTYCGKCKQLIENRRCGESGKGLTTCKSTESHMFKAIVSVPGTNGRVRKTKRIKTRDLKLAIQEKILFERTLEANNYQTVEAGKLLDKSVQPKPILLVDCMAMYIGYLNNIDVEAHMIKKRSKKHLWEVENHFRKKLGEALKYNGIDPNLLRIDQVTDRVVALLHDYILDTLEHSNKTYNKIMATLRQFMSWLIMQKDYDIDNPFTRVQRRPERKTNTIIDRLEFEMFLSTIRPDTGWDVMPNGDKRERYKPWLKQCYQLALQTGLRREEFLRIRFNHIVTDELGKPMLIEVPNLKVNRQNGIDSELMGIGNIKFVPVTQELLELLYNLGYEENKESDAFLIGNEEEMSRETMMEFISKAFSYFWKRTGIKKTVYLKHLRKTYLTALLLEFGDDAKVISDHSGLDILKGHYGNNEELVKAARAFSVFRK